MSVGLSDVVSDRGLQLSCSGERPAFQPTSAQNGKPALHEVEPRRARRREVEVEPRMLDQPVMHQGRLVRLQVVEHEMHLQIACDAALDLLQEGAELDAAMTRLAAPDHRSGFYVEGGKQAERAMPAIVNRTGFPGGCLVWIRRSRLAPRP